MFRTRESRTALRAGVAAVMTGLAALGSALTDGAISSFEVVTITSAFVGAIALWYGIGATTPTEPFLNSDRVVEVPAKQIEPV